MALLVSVLLGVAIYLLSYTAKVSSLPLSFSLDPTTLTAFATLVFLILAALALLITIIQYANWGYHIDEHSLFLRRGLLSSETETIPFYKVINTSFDQSVIQRMFGVGQLRVDQEDDSSTWSDIDKGTASSVIEMVSTKGNIQPIAFSSGQFPPQPSSPAPSAPTNQPTNP